MAPPAFFSQKEVPPPSKEKPTRFRCPGKSPPRFFASPYTCETPPVFFFPPGGYDSRIPLPFLAFFFLSFPPVFLWHREAAPNVSPLSFLSPTATISHLRQPFSSAFFLCEQLPRHYPPRPYLLNQMNPTKLMRDSFFVHPFFL